jgi:hypothetical protein
MRCVRLFVSLRRLCPSLCFILLAFGMSGSANSQTARATTTATTTPSVLGSISGKVRETGGSYLQALIVAVSGRVTRQTVSAADGSFTLKSLPPGSYTLCAQVPSFRFGPNDDPYVDDCFWQTGAAPTLALSNGQNRTDAAISLSRGRRYRVRVDDPGNILPPPKGVFQGGDLALTLSGPSGASHNMPIVRREAGRTFHEIVIPYSLQHQFQVISSTYSVTDSGGKELTTAQSPTAVRVNQGDTYTVPVVKVTAKGAKP